MKDVQAPSKMLDTGSLLVSHFLYPGTSSFVCLGVCFALCVFQSCVGELELGPSGVDLRD